MLSATSTTAGLQTPSNTSNNSNNNSTSNSNGNNNTFNTPQIIITRQQDPQQDQQQHHPENLTSRFRIKRPANNLDQEFNEGSSILNSMNNNFTPSSSTAAADQGSGNTNGSDHNTSDREENKHSYSCKRCRRLKKKCTRTIPECQNCYKAGESCEYVPRAPRRKKSEILKSLQEHQQLRQADSTNRSPLSSTPVLRTQDANLHFTANDPFPKFNQLNPLQPLTGGPGPVSLTPSSSTAVRSYDIPFGQQQQQQQQQQGNSFTDHSPRSFNLGTTDPFSYKTNGSSNVNGININNNSNNNGSSSALPPLSSITTNITNQPQPQHIPIAHQPPQHIQKHQNQVNSSYLHFSPPATRQGSDDSQSQLLQQQPALQSLNGTLPRSPVLENYKSLTSTQGNLQNRLLTSSLGIDDFIEPNTTVVRPNIETSFMIELVSHFFEENYHSYPFLDKNSVVNYILGSDLNKLDSLPSSESFPIFMVMFIGYCSLERVGRINTDVTVKRYLISKSIEQTNNVITFDNVESIKNLLLLGIYSLFDIAGFTSWYISGNITRLTLSFGLNRNMGTRSRNAQDREIDLEKRNRIFWSAYNFDRLVSISLGRPFGIDDDDINIPFPNKLECDDAYDIELVTAIISLRQIEGKILRNIHSVNSGSKASDDFTKNEILKTLRIEVEDWYHLTNTLSSYHVKNSIYNVSWFTAHYYQLTMLLYRPSFLIPKPTKETLSILGKSCLQCLAYTYNLHTSHLLQPSWVTVYRFLTQCTTIVYCLCHWCIDLVESKTEINLCIEILESFGDRWPVSGKSAQIFKEINRAIYEIKVNQDWQLSGTQELTNKFFEASRAYHDALSNNNVDIWYDDPVIVNSERQQT